VKLLIDTHVFLWLMTAPDRLAPTVRAVCEDTANTLVLSVVSLWEMQIKCGLGKLSLHLPLRQLVHEQVEQGPFELLAIVAEHVFALDALPAHHQDPFDRLLIAQAAAERIRLVSQDRKIEAYRTVIDLVS
jgi:PIN domain nuclease of toxin-antitoxin system